LRYQNLRACLACEFVGTFALVTSGALEIIYFHSLPGVGTFLVHVANAAVVTLVVSSSIMPFGNISGAQLNTTVTISQAITHQMPRRYAVFFVVVQLSAAVVSGVVLRALAGPAGLSVDYGLPKLEEGATILAGIGLEAFGGFWRSVASLYSSTHFKDQARVQATFTGVILFLLTSFIGPYTGACFNAAVYLGPAIASMSFKDQYVYWVAPLLGALASSAWFFSTRGNLPWWVRQQEANAKRSLNRVIKLLSGFSSSRPQRGRCLAW
jgi:glycerol uptake facilitator-like aquaporin